MKFFILIIGMMLALNLGRTQQSLPEFEVEQKEIEKHVYFLASDSLQGRRTGEAGNEIAAQYIADYYEKRGLSPLKRADGYFQPIEFDATRPPVSGSLEIENLKLNQFKDLLILMGDAVSDLSARAVFAGQGWVDEDMGHNDYEDLDVKGKVVFVLPGTPAGEDPNTIFGGMAKKRKFAAEHGAVALFEFYRLKNFPWSFFRNYFGKESIKLSEPEDGTSTNIPYGWVREPGGKMTKDLINGKKLKVTLNSSGFIKKKVISNNVAGFIEGEDPKLKDEYLILSAHFDHVGTGKNGGGAFTEKDSIFNGARDNALGVTALLTTVKALTTERPKRSILFLALTAEESGLLGSKYYTDHPLVDLDKCIFNLNTDGAGYNDTSYISIIGMGRTGTDEQITLGAKAFGLKVFPNPAPEQNLFDRGDNVSFARKGIPAANFSPGLTGFTREILAHYHQVSDEAESLNFGYVLKFCKSYAHTARLIANMDKRPFWVSGDKYEALGEGLYKHKE